jgi:hypothetical protein
MFAGVCCAFPALSQLTGSQIRPATQNGPTPHTAEFKITNVRTLANGTTITQESTEVRAIDSQGRSMSAFTAIPASPDETPHTNYNVVDPVAKTTTSWNSQSRIVKVTKQPPPVQNGGQRTCWVTTPESVSVVYKGAGTEESPQAETGKGVPAPEASSRRPHVGSKNTSVQTTTEDLGMETINGLLAHGRRTTQTIPAGAMGNDQQLVTTRETWWADTHNIGMSIREIADDPRSGKYTRELVNFSLDEPDSSLFQPPADYEVQIEEKHQVPCQ